MGDIPQIETNYYYEGEMFGTLPKPKLSGLYSILGKAISIYEYQDDMGRGGGQSLLNGNMGRPIACCNIIPALELSQIPQDYFVARQSVDDRRRLNEL